MYPTADDVSFRKTVRWHLILFFLFRFFWLPVLGKGLRDEQWQNDSRVGIHLNRMDMCNV